MLKKKMLFNVFLLGVVPALFFITGVATLSHYGISWDESFHFQRGQAYLHYFLTGREDFLSLPAYPKLTGDSDFMGREGEQDIYVNARHTPNPPNPNLRRSYYQSDVFTFSFLVSGFDGGHPPASDILASFFNYIFYHKLGILGDIEAYHLFEIFASTALILTVAIFVYYNFGVLPAVVSSFSLALYPLFWAESHFNIKDPPEAAFFGLTLVAFFFGIVSKKLKFIIAAAVVFGLALGTKLNSVFIPFILLLWLIFRLFVNKVKIVRGLYAALLFFPIIAGFIFFAFWPFLWENPIENFLKVIDYYRGIGLGRQPGMEKYIIAGFNTYPWKWIVYTTPLPILFFSLVGLAYSIYMSIFKKNDILFFVLLWFLVPILRVSIFNTNIYGGVRQIMEFVSAMAMLSGIGIWFLYKNFRPLQFLFLGIVGASFIFVVWELVRVHPNENVYFNQLIGGLSGAAKKGVPSWGNTYGNVYLQGTNWINNHAEENAKLGLPIANMVNVPRIKLRYDINFSNAHISGIERQGEYVMEMAYDWEPKKWYGFQYYDTFLVPVYEIRVDGVPLLKIWKNDLAHTKPGFVEEMEYRPAKVTTDKNTLLVDLGREVTVTRLNIKHDSKNCSKQQGGYIRLSKDGKEWMQEPDTIGYPQIPVKWLGSNNETFVFLFAAKKARFIFLDTEMKNSCILNLQQIKISGIKEGLKKVSLLSLQ